jgi:predicted TIM-barrel fold metal-dependent hydrolase
MGATEIQAVEVDRGIPFVDAYVHVYDLARNAYGWLHDPGLEGHTALLGDYKMIRSTIGSPERLVREFYGANVSKCVHVEADFPGTDPVAETAWLEDVATRTGFPAAIIACCDLSAADAPAVLDRHMAASSRMRGVRMRAHPSDSNVGSFRQGLKALALRGLSYELNASPGNLTSGLDAVIADPGLQVVVGHAGFPARRDAEYLELWRREVSALAEVENVACKVSGLPMVDHAWTADSLRPLVLHCIDAFGPERVIFGSNWPVDILYSTYLELLDTYRTILVAAGFSRAEQELMLYRNAESIYRI